MGRILPVVTSRDTNLVEVRHAATRRKEAKRKRQYEHIKESEAARGRSNKTAERIAAATTNKTRAKKGETKSCSS